ncbi:MAG: hypothetical protein HYV95_02900 [Opitutae bacterium]|nr:hypothetical protein [Opitutae bacterium]
MPSSNHRPLSTVNRALRAYFRSGWAFFIPYLAAYLLYAWLKWPVNPATGGEGIVKEISEGVGALPPTVSPSTVLPSTGISSLLPHSLIPPLLHVYWALHAIHVGLAAMALRVWWCAHNPASRGPSTLSSQLSTLWPLVPWLLLALVFYIPGIYLEWPSDPWEHLRRINEWHVLDTVTAHSAWKKSSYFLPYSLTGHTFGLSQLTWLNYYYTGICLLLSWQYYRLARAVGLGERASFVFVLLNVVTFGNNIFSFYRYYGLSSSILAQIGAVALTRIALEALRPPVIGYQLPITGHRSPSTAYPLLAARYSLLQSVIAGLILLPLIAFNHIQGLGIAGLGVLAVVVWRLIEWRRTMIFWLLCAAVILSIATVLWYPRHPAIDDVYRARGWLNTWYGFNFHSQGSPSQDRALHILGFVGLLNLAAGLWLVIRRNHLAGWMALMPLLALSLPCFALPFSHILTVYGSSPDIILTFHRLLFAVSGSPALVVLLASALTPTDPAAAPRTNHASRWPGVRLPARAACALLLLALASLAALSPAKSTYNRFWCGLQVTPGDLSLRHLVAVWNQQNVDLASADNALVVTSPLGTQVRDTLAGTPRLVPLRQSLAPPAFLAQEFQFAVRAAASAATLCRGRVEPSTSPDWTIFSEIGSARSETRLVANLTGSPTPWIRLGGQPPQQMFNRGARLVGNLPGQASDAFSPELIRVDHNKHYRVSAALRQTGNPKAVSYLAVAWYDENAELLRSNRPVPKGAGEPLGWVNGNYSYFGPAGCSTAENWTTYEISFGRGERAAIPDNAVFLRVGALLNHDGAPSARILLSEVRLAEKLGYARALVVLPDYRHLFSPSSASAQLSGHWSDQRVVLDHAGINELRGQLLDGGRRVSSSRQTNPQTEPP